MSECVAPGANGLVKDAGVAPTEVVCGAATGAGVAPELNTSSTFERVFGPKFPYPTSPGFATPYLT